MRHLFFITGLCSLIICLMAARPVDNHLINRKHQKKGLPRIAIAGLGIESSTFSPARTDEAAFHAKYGADVFSIYPFFSADSPLCKSAI